MAPRAHWELPSQPEPVPGANSAHQMSEKLWTLPATVTSAPNRKTTSRRSLRNLIGYFG
jgi:hypothetical protein